MWRNVVWPKRGVNPIIVTMSACDVTFAVMWRMSSAIVYNVTQWYYGNDLRYTHALPSTRGSVNGRK